MQYICQDVHTTELLEEHDCNTGHQSTSIAWRGKQLEKRFLDFADLFLFSELIIDEEEISGCLELGVSELAEGQEGFLVSGLVA